MSTCKIRSKLDRETTEKKKKKSITQKGLFSLVQVVSTK